MVKFASYYWEKAEGYVYAIFLSLGFALCADFSRIHVDPLLYDKLVDFSGILFGFLITILTILIQASNSSLELLKKHNRFKHLINLNKEVIAIAALVCAYTVSILALKGNINMDYFMFCKKWGLTGLLFLTTLLAFKTFRYLRIFYKIIQSA